MKWIIVLLTWFTPNVALDLQELPAGKTEAACERMIKSMTGDWVNDPDGFGFKADCQLNPGYKPKGKRK